jgi:hypothetical protein
MPEAICDRSVMFCGGQNLAACSAKAEVSWHCIPKALILLILP